MNLRKIKSLIKTKNINFTYYHNLKPQFLKSTIKRQSLIKINKKRFSEKPDFETKLTKWKLLMRKEYKNNPLKYKWLACLLISGILWFFLKYQLYSKLTLEELETLLLSGEIESIKIFHSPNSSQNLGFSVISKNNINYKIDLDNWKNLIKFIKKVEQERGMKIKIELLNNPNFNFYLSYIELFTRALFILAMYKYIKSQKNITESIAGQEIQKTGQKFTSEMSKIRFKDVAGMEESKYEISEFVDFLQNPKKYKKLGAKLPKGALLAGPPGTGKTLLAKACAGEAGVPFYFASGSEFIQLYVGVGASRVRELFRRAKKTSPSIIFIDEIDAVGKKRNNNLGSNMESDSTLNQLLVEMDGFATDDDVIVFAATNRKELLDPALLRPGRFDRSIDVTLPDLDGRKDIFKVHLGPIKLENKENKIKDKNTEKVEEKKNIINPDDLELQARRLASLTPGFSGADIANICNEAAIQAVRNNHKSVKPSDFELAIEKIIGGLPKPNMDNKKQERVVAVHESGHGVISWFLEGASPLLKLTIIPRSKGALGFAQYLPSEQSLEKKIELEHRIISVLAGRIAEEEFFGEVTTGAYDDLEKAYRIAHSIVTQLGMKENIGYLSLEQNQYGIKKYSDFTNYEIDKAVSEIIGKCADECRELVRKYKGKIEEMSEVLLEKKTIDLKVIVGVLGERPFPPKENFKAYLDVTNMDKELN